MKNKYYRIRTVDDSWGEIQLARLDCPVCGFNYNHMTGIEKRYGRDSYQAWEGRGNLIKLFMKGECGHEWNLCVGFHKGQAFIFCEQIDFWS